MTASTATPLNRQQILGFWAAWFGWTLDGMDSVIYALVLSPAMKELLPKSGFANSPADIAFAGSILFALFLVGWGLSFIWGPLADRFGRARCLAVTILIFSVFTGAAAFAQNVWELALFRFLAGIGIGGEWAMAGTYVAEAWPEDRRKMGAGYLQTGYYAGFFLAAALNFTVGATFGWRAMFLCGAAPILVALFTLSRVKEPPRWERGHAGPRSHPLRMIFSGPYLKRTIVNSALVSVAIIGLLVPIFAKDWFFALMSLIVFPLCLLPIVRLGKRVRKVGAQEEYDSRALMSVMQETFSGIRLVKAYCREDHETQKFERTNLSMTRNMVKWAKAIELIGPIVEAVASLGIAAGLIYAWDKDMGADDFFLLVFGLTQIYPPIKELSRVQLFLQKTTVAASMVFEILDRQPDIQDAPNAGVLGRVKGAIGFNDVTFHYRDARGARVEPPAARGITLNLEPGKFYAVVGPSAAGKSTLFNLMLRFYDPDSGSITLDGTDIKTITQASLRENIGLVSQDTFIFHDTLRENIRYGRLDATEEQIIAAAKKAHAHEFIMQIKEGYDASAGEGGRNLSGGQKQRLSIARAILHDAPALLLDEATSALDTESEKVIQDAIHTLSEGKTVIAIAHRLSTVLAAHQIIVMDAGRVVAVGSNEELLRTSPLYQRLHSLQFGTEEATAEA